MVRENICLYFNGFVGDWSVPWMWSLVLTQLLELSEDHVTDFWLKHDCPGSVSQVICCRITNRISKFVFPDLQKISWWEFLWKSFKTTAP
jgi:hypothetical protein